MFTVTDTSFVRRDSGLMASTLIDSKAIVSNWLLNCLSSPIIRPRLVDLVLLRRSFLLDSWRDLRFSLFVALHRIAVCGLKRPVVIVFLANQASHVPLKSQTDLL